MSAPQLRLQTTFEQQPILHLPRKIFLQFSGVLNFDELINLHFGQQSTKVRIAMSHELDEATGSICSRAAKRLLLPRSTSLSLYPDGPNDLRLGPLIGLLISTEKLQKLRRGHPDHIYSCYTRYAHEYGACLVFFCISGLNFYAECLDGYQLIDGHWYPIRTPLPRVVYDRCFGFGARKEAVRLRHLVRRKGIQVINETVKITKLETYRVLQRHSTLRAIVPVTEPLTEKALEAVAADFPAVYLKPDNLSRGQGVFRASRQEDGWLLEQSNQHGHQSWTFQRSTDLLQLLPLEHPYLVQQAIDLACYENNAYDLRAAVQKDGQGKWQVAGLVARLAPQRGVITSPRSGGRVMPAAAALAASFGKAASVEILADITTTAQAVAAELEGHYGTCVNLGIDLGVSKDGLVWLIEVNSRPLTVSLNRLSDPGVSGRINRYPIAYSAHLELSLPVNRGDRP